MALYAAFIRGINVGGNKPLPMADLKAACESIGFTAVRTFLQSGNVVFKTTRKDPAALLEKALSDYARVFTRTIDELRAIVGKHPFASRPNSSWVHVMFLEGEPSKTAQAALKAASLGPEELHVDGRELYLYYTNGAGTSKLTNALIERKLGMAGTARNINTLTKMLAAG